LNNLKLQNSSHQLNLPSVFQLHSNLPCCKLFQCSHNIPFMLFPMFSPNDISTIQCLQRFNEIPNQVFPTIALRSPRSSQLNSTKEIPPQNLFSMLHAHVRMFCFPRRLHCSHSVFSLESRSIDVPLFFVFVKLFVVSLQFETLTLKVFSVFAQSRVTLVLESSQMN
jgi:hypothetical protein